MWAGEKFDFSKLFDAQTKKYGRTQQAMDETFRLCLEKNILKPFLESRKKEVLDIMTTLFSQEQVWEIEKYNIAKDSQEKERENGIRSLVTTIQDFVSDKQVAIQKLIEQYQLSPTAAKEKVDIYWQ